MMTGIEATETEATATAQGQAEGQTPETTQAPAEKDDFTEKFMRLARRERAFQQQQAEFKAKMTEFEKMKAEYDEYKAKKSTWKENPYDFLEHNGISYDELTQYLLEHGKPADPQQELLQRLERLEKEKELERERIEKEKEEQIEAERQKTVEGFRGLVEKFIDSGEYELVKANEATDLVMEVMRQQYEHDLKTDGKAKLMEIKDACAVVEDHLEGEIQKLKELNKVKALFQSQKEDPKQSLFGQQASKPQSVTTTLTNSMRAASEAATPQHRKPTNDESLKAAAALIKWNN